MSTSNAKRKYASAPAFTIIELLIVIVVIGILVTIVIISYIGIQNKARIAVITSDLDSTSKQLAISNVTNGSFPSSLSTLNNGSGPQSSGTAYQYTYYPATNSYCVTGIIGGSAYMITDSTTPTPGVCPGQTGPGGTTVNGGVVTTLAGSTNGNLDGTGTAARFSYPDGIAIDNSGNFFIADRGNNEIRKMTVAGVVTTFAGSGAQGASNGTGTAAQFYYPEGIAIDSSNTLYVTDRANNLIRKITSAGAVSTFAGSGTAGSADGTGTSAQFNAPYGIAVDSSGTVYVVDSGNNEVRKITSAGVVTTLAGQITAGNVDGTGTSAQFSSPYGIVIASSGDLYVADSNNNTIRKVTTGGTVTTFAGDGTTGYIDATGTAAELRHPFGIAVDASGNFYVTDRSNYRIRMITSSGVVTTLAGSGTLGSVDGTGTAAQFYYSQGIAVDGSGALYVVDQGDHRIRKIQ
jgi:prepilin-type N-terminal cleavage/methylation domain-containing protein